MNTIALLNEPARAWAPFEPGPDRPWDRARVAHLHRRAGFAAPWDILERDVKEGPDASVERLLAGEATSADGMPAAEFVELLDAMAARLGPSATSARLQGIWLYRMIFTPHPLLERLTLFWHDHFATSQAKVNNTALMQRQNNLLRAHALGDFKSLLAAIGKDPAMLIWLDSTANRRAKPNENYAREVMELFSLGRGRYSEKDIQEAARAMTGYFVVAEKFSELPAQHDGGVKTILGRTGPFSGSDIPRILLDQPACAEFLCGKLFRHFISEIDEPSSALIAPLAESFRASDYDLKVPVRTILRSNLLHDAAIRRRRVKGPVEFAVGAIRALEVLRPSVSAEALAEACTRMGQSLYAPPSVAGWNDGPAWINTTALLTRANLVLALLSNDNKDFGGRCDPKALAARHGANDPRSVARFYSDLLVQDAFEAPVRDRIRARAESADAAKEVATLVLTSPEFQLA